MKILHFIARMNIGGTATYLMNLIEGLIESGHEVMLVVGNVPTNEKEDLRIFNIPFRRVRSLSRSLSLEKDLDAESEISNIIKDFKPDIVHSHTFKAGLLVRIRRRKVPIVHSFHGHHLNNPEFGRLKRYALIIIERFLAKRTNKIVTSGMKVQEDLVNSGVGTSDQYVSISPGITAPQLIPKKEIVGKFGLSMDSTIVLWMGRLTEVKRPDRVLSLAQKYPMVEFLIAGDGELFQQLRSCAPRNVHLLGNQLNQEMLSIADLLLLTSDSEGMPLSLVEAQMSGVPCIATDVGSVSEIIIDGETGLLSTNTLQGLESALDRFLDNSDLRTRMSISARERAVRLFSRERMVHEHMCLYNTVLMEKQK